MIIRKIIRKIIVFTWLCGIFSAAGVLSVIGCAHPGYPTPASGEGQSYSDGGGSSAHPATWLTEQFHVKRALPSHAPNNNYEFFFKRCNMAGEDWPHSRTSYGCNYP